MESAKHVRGYLSSLGYPDSAGDFFFERCNYLWGNDGWCIEGDGIHAGGRTVVPLKDYPLFMSGLPYNQEGLQLEVIRVEPPPETGEIIDGDPLCCQLCGRKTATLVGMETHMRLRHDGAPNVAPPKLAAPPEPVEIEAAVAPKAKPASKPVAKKAKKR